MKLAIITNYWIGSDGGGVREYTKNLVSHLKQKNVDVIVLFRKGVDASNHKLPESKSEFKSEAKKILMKEKPDAILCLGGWFTELPAISYKKEFKNTKILALFLSNFDSSLPLHKRMLNNRILNQFDKVGFVSKGLEDNVKNVAQLTIRSETFVLYPGIEVEHPTEQMVNEFKDKFGITNEDIILLGSGLTAVHVKKEGAKILIKALSKIVRDHPNVKLILTRNGQFSDELKEYAVKEGMKDHIIFTEDLSNPYPAIVASDIYTHITLGDGLPLSLLEAMAFGKPIVASNIGGIPEAIANGQDGIIVNNDVDEVIIAINTLIEDKELGIKYGESSKRVAHEKFKWEKTADFLIQICNANE